MPEQNILPTDPAEIAVANAPADPFDLTDITQEDFTPPVSRPRNPDGTFAAVATVSAAEPAAAPQAPRHPRWLTQDAIDFGFTDEEIAGLTTDALGMAVQKLHRQLHNQRAQAATERTLVQQTPAAPAPVEEDVSLDFGGVDAAGNALNVDDLHPGLVNAIKGVARTANKRVKDLENQLAEERRASAERTNREAVGLIDSAFDALSKKGYEKYFGKGSGTALKDKPEYQRRCAALQSAGVGVANVDRSTVLSKIKAAADMLFGAPASGDYADAAAQAAAAAQTAPAQRITTEQWNAAGVARPTARNGAAEPKGEALATKNLAERMRANGIPAATDDDSEIVDGLL